MSPRALAIALTSLALAAACGNGGGGDDPDRLDPGTVPEHPFLADSPWPITHQSPYAQASSPLPGPGPDDALQVEHLATDVASITLAFSAPYPDGERVIWGSSALSVFKVDLAGDAMEVIAKQSKQSGLENLIAGAYTLLDDQGRFYVTEGIHIDRYADAVPGDRLSGIEKLGRFTLPEPVEGEVVIGLSLSWDGRLIFATSHGRIGALSRDLGSLEILSLGADEEVSNSIALDEAGGIYIVTSRRMHRVQWTGSRLSTDPTDGAWSAAYETGPAEPFPGRLGIGSGSTPSLMGAGRGDRFVVITDGRELMNLVLFWRDDIPDDGEAVRAGADRRVAAEVAITFGEQGADSSISEQSVLVHGYRAVVVNNDYGPTTSAMEPVIQGIAPPGIEQFEWDPPSRTLRRTWVVPGVSCPNGIPAMSRPSARMYCVGKRGDDWTLEALDWQTGAEVFHQTLGPGLDYNSTYAGAEIGPDGAFYSGTFSGLVRVRVR